MSDNETQFEVVYKKVPPRQETLWWFNPKMSIVISIIGYFIALLMETWTHSGNDIEYQRNAYIVVLVSLSMSMAYAITGTISVLSKSNKLVCYTEKLRKTLLFAFIWLPFEVVIGSRMGLQGLFLVSLIIFSCVLLFVQSKHYNPKT